MVQYELIDTSFHRQLDCFVVRRMSPAAKVVVLLRRVHRVVHEHPRVAHELDEPGAPSSTCVVFGALS